MVPSFKRQWWAATNSIYSEPNSMSCHKKKRKQTTQHVPGNWELWTPCAGGFALKNLPKISDCKVDQKKDQHILNIYWYWLPTMQSKFDIYIIFVFKIKFLILLTFASCYAFVINCYFRNALTTNSLWLPFFCKNFAVDIEKFPIHLLFPENHME